jgi:parallel beta-helix repeat protein
MQRVIKILVAVCPAALFIAPAAACVKSDTRFAASSNTLYIETPVTCTPTQLAAFLKPSVLEQTSATNRTWLLKANLRITGGGTLLLHGSEIGGDTDEFRLLSNNSPASHVRINPRWGTLDIRWTRVRSWDAAAGTSDNDTSNGRAYIHAESFLEADGVTARESRMDIADSEIDHLGFHAAVSYGLVWKVIGDNALVPDLYDRVNVYGSLVRSQVHHNNMGFYSFGGQDIQITDNEISHNELYGIDPHDDSDFLVIQRNVSHDNGAHGIICSRRCNDLVITDNTVYNNEHGIMLHRDVVDTLVANNYVFGNRDNGIAVFESHFNTIRDNFVEDNEKGIRLSLGSHDNLIENNLVSGNSEVGLYLYQGADPPETTNGRPSDNVFRGNNLINNGRLIKARDSDRITFTDNTFSGSQADIEIYDSSDIEIVGNVDLMATMEISSEGAGAGFSTVHLETSRDVETKIDPFGTIELTNSAGQVFDPEENAGSNAISAQGSRLLIDYALTGASSHVSALPLFATATTGTFSLSAPVCSAPESSWQVSAATTDQGAQFRLACLTANTPYGLLRDGVLLMTLTSDAVGTLVFADTFTAASHTYQVQRQ